MTTFLQVKNRAVSTLASGIDNVVTSLTVATGEGAKFPTPGNGFHITIDDEILKCTARTTDTLTVTRAQEGTTAVAHNAGAAVRLNITAAIVQQLQDLMPVDIGARVYNNANLSIPDSSYTVLTFNSERYDTDDIHDTTANTSRLTCKTAGKFLIVAGIEFSGIATGRRIVRFLLNNVYEIVKFELGLSSANVFRATTTTIYDLQVNDYLEVSVYQSSGAALDVLALGYYSPEFMIQRIG
jgi:hypothetical protein